MVPADMQTFFAASAGVAGALIGLLFVAISVSAERLARAEASGQLYRIRAYAALTAFINALAVSLFSLLPGEKIGLTALVVAVVGLLFIVAALLSLIRLRHLRWGTVRDGVFLVALGVTWAFELYYALNVLARPGDTDSVETIGSLVVVCFLVGIARAWELIGGPSIGFAHEVAALVRREPGEGERVEDGAGAAAGSREAGGPPRP